MTRSSVIENKISATKKYLEILKRYQDYSKQKIESDIDIRGAVERYLYLAVQSAIDLAEAVVAHKGFRKPSTMAESFYILAEKDAIPVALSEKLGKMAGFRNIIAHDYGDIDYDILFDILKNSLSDIHDFLKITESL